MQQSLLPQFALNFFKLVLAFYSLAGTFMLIIFELVPLDHWDPSPHQNLLHPYCSHLPHWILMLWPPSFTDTALLVFSFSVLLLHQMFCHPQRMCWLWSLLEMLSCGTWLPWLNLSPPVRKDSGSSLHASIPIPVVSHSLHLSSLPSRKTHHLTVPSLIPGCRYDAHTLQQHSIKK